jgi:hypothetical protein
MTQEILNRRLKVERIYRIANYEDIRITDEISDIPHPLSTDGEFMNKLTDSMLLGVELTAYKYFDLQSTYRDMPVKEVIALLNDQKTSLMQTIKITKETK